MKFFILVLCAFVPFTLRSQCMLAPISLEDRVINADAVIEGRVLFSLSFWNNDRSLIYTAHKLEVYRNFKGHTAPYAFVITEGGRVGNQLQVASPALELHVGDCGVFLLGKEYDLYKEGDYPVYKAFSGPQGFVAYDMVRHSASDPFRTYKEPFHDLFVPIMKYSGRAYDVVKASARSLIIPGENDHLVVPGPIRTMAVPAITSFSPATINAGEGAVLTITGTNFGAFSSGNSIVRFRNADDGGGTYLANLESDIVSWTDTEIQIRVRPRTGTGTIQVSNVDGTATSAGSLTVNYNRSNITSSNTVPAGKFFAPELIGQNGTGGYDLLYYTGFDADAAAKASFERAMQTWHCNTNVGFVLTGGTTATRCQADDGVNIVSFDDQTSCQLPCGVLGISFSYYSGCISAPNEYWYLKGTDVIMKEDGTVGSGVCGTTINWEYGPAAPAGGKMDFESVSVHELGHSHQLGHVINSSYVMHYSIGPNQMKRDLDGASDIAGGNAVLTWSDNQNAVTFCGRDAHSRITPSGCPIPRITFAATALPVAEASADTDLGTCRPYKDYTVTMSISGAPTGAATVTFTRTGSTADSSADYQLHNAAGSSIINTLAFPDGGTTDQTFTLRVYDDAAVEASDVLVLNFSISGATNALKGLGDDTTITVSFADNDALPSAGTTTVFNENFEAGAGTWSFLLFDGSSVNRFRINTGGALFGTRAAYITSNTAGTPPPFNYNNAATSDVLLRSPAINTTGLSNMTLSFYYQCDGQAGTDRGSLLYSTDGSTFFGIATPEFSGTAATTQYTVTLPAGCENQATLYLGWRWANNNDGVGSNPPFIVDNVEVYYGTPAPDINDDLTSVSVYLGPEDTVVVYDAGGELMCILANRTTHNYGCTSVQIDRTGTGATAFHKTNATELGTDKTLLITPTYNNLGGSYDITVYYTETEMAGWEAATGNVRGDITLFKTASAISNVSPANKFPASNPGWANAYGASPVTAVYNGGVGYSVKATFSSGFSGFGGGLPDPGGPVEPAPLSLGKLTLTGNHLGDVAQLNMNLSNVPGGSAVYLLRDVTAGFAQPETVGKGLLNGQLSLTDRTALPTLAYYRAVYTLPDGDKLYSNTVALAPMAEGLVRYDLAPNPANGTVAIYYHNSDAFTLQVHNALGQLVHSQDYRQTGTGSVPLDLSGWKSGLYTVTIQSNTRQHYLKLMVQ